MIKVVHPKGFPDDYKCPPSLSMLVMMMMTIAMSDDDETDNFLVLVYHSSMNAIITWEWLTSIWVTTRRQSHSSPKPFKQFSFPK